MSHDVPKFDLGLEAQLRIERDVVRMANERAERWKRRYDKAVQRAELAEAELDRFRKSP